MASEWKDHLRRAVRIAGSQAKLAAAIQRHGRPCSQSKITWLLNEAAEISADDALLIESVTDHEVTARELCPHLPWPEAHAIRQ